MYEFREEDKTHKVFLFRLLKNILQDKILANSLMFKGGTYALLRGVLNRFSVDLDFDLIDLEKRTYIKNTLHKIFEDNGFVIKVNINDKPSLYNKYEPVTLLELNMLCRGHTLDTLFANKLFAAKARFDKTGKIAGRDFYDIHHFFMQGLPINKKVVEDLAGKSFAEFISDLKALMSEQLNQRVLNEDLNFLIEPKILKALLPNLQDEILGFLDSVE